MEAEDEQRIQNDIDGGAGQRGDHGELRAAVGANDRVQRLAKHIERNAQRNIEEVLLRLTECLFVDAAAEHGQDRILKDQIDGRQHDAGDDAQPDGISDAAVGILPAIRAQADADERAASVADHHGNGQRHHRQREHHRIGGVAVGAQIAGVGDEDLVDDVVQRRHQQGNDARNGILAHQRADPLGLQKGVGFLLHGIFLPNLSRPAHSGRACPDKKACGLSWIYATQATR